MRTLIEQMDHDSLGRLIAYGGGGTGLAITKAAEIAEQSTIYDWGYWMFGAAILGRLVFDVIKFLLDKRKK